MSKPRAAFFTLGCKVNQYESQVMMGLFADAGFEIVPPESVADVYVVNSCTVTATGDKKSRQVLRRFRRLSPGAVLVLCGCFPQAFPDAAAAIPEADIVMGTKNRGAVVTAVQSRILDKTRRLVDIPAHTRDEPFEPMAAERFHSRTRAFLKIEDGCERRCSYCIIPDARGPVRSKPLEDLRRELAALAGHGYREVVLVGINLSSYGLDLGLSLSDAVEAACGLPGLARVRLGSLEPELITPEAVARWFGLPELCPQFHLSLQSGCDETLGRMRRQYDTAEYRRIAARLRAAFPGCALTTDVMVGFPGETEEEHRRSEEFVREMAFARVHVFAYSPRSGTPAAQLPQVAPDIAARRAASMAQTAREGHRAHLDSLVGTTREVLFETRGKDGAWQGYTPCYAPVRVISHEELAGEIRPVRVTQAAGAGCRGELA